MDNTVSVTSREKPFGALLRHWRRARGMSQLSLSLAGDVSQRHISFLESGRASPSRDMILHLADVLEIPFRDQNLLLGSAGFVAAFRQSDLADPEMSPVRRALEFMLRQQEPYAAAVVDPCWNVLAGNEASRRLLAVMLGVEKLTRLAESARPVNAMRLLFDPEGLRPFLDNWEETVRALLLRIQREAALSGGNAEGDEERNALIRDLLSYPGVPSSWGRPHWEQVDLPVLPVNYKKDGNLYRFFTAITTFGTPLDITVQELRLETFFPADEKTADFMKELALDPRPCS